MSQYQQLCPLVIFSLTLILCRAQEDSTTQGPTTSAASGATTPTTTAAPGGPTSTTTAAPGGTTPTTTAAPGGTTPTTTAAPGGTTPTTTAAPGGTTPTTTAAPGGTTPTTTAAPGAPTGADTVNSPWQSRGFWERTTLEQTILCVPNNNDSIQNCASMKTLIPGSTFHAEAKNLNVTSAECMYYAAKQNITVNTTIRCVVEATYNGTSGLSAARFNLYNEKFNESSTILGVAYWGKGNISTEPMTPLVNVTAS